MWLELGFPLHLYPRDAVEARVLRRQGRSWLGDAAEDRDAASTADHTAQEDLDAVREELKRLETVEALTFGDLESFRSRRAEFQKAVQEKGAAYNQAITMLLQAKKRFERTEALLKDLGALESAAEQKPQPGSPAPAES